MVCGGGLGLVFSRSPCAVKLKLFTVFGVNMNLRVEGSKANVSLAI